MSSAEAPVDALDAGTLSSKVWNVSLPVLFAGVSETVIHVTDTALLARVGTVELTAIAFADTLFDIWTVAVVGLAAAMQIVIARRAGEQREGAVDATFRAGMALLLGAGVLLGLALWAVSPVLSEVFTNSAEVSQAVDRFLRTAAFGVVFYALTLGYSALYVGLAKTRILVSATVVLTVSNFVLSYALILGNLGMPRLGMQGAAISFVAAEALTFGYLTVRVLRRRSAPPPGSRQETGASRLPLRLLLSVSYPVTFQVLLEGVRWLLFFFFLAQVSEEAVAWSNIVYSCYALLLIPTEGFAETTDALVSNVIGGGRGDALRLLLRRVVRPAYLLTLPLVAVVLLAPGAVLSVFTRDPATIDGTAGSLRIVALAMLVAIPAEIWLAAVAGTGDTVAAFMIELLLSGALVGGTYLVAVVLGLSLAWVWAVVLAASLLGLTLSYWWVRSGYWEEMAI